jgi:hypothetical protein
VQIYAKTAKSQNLSLQIGIESDKFHIFAKDKQHLGTSAGLAAPI